MHGRTRQARSTFNLTVDQRPAAVVFPESAEDAATAIRFAAANGRQVVAQGTAHNPGPLEPLDEPKARLRISTFSRSRRFSRRSSDSSDPSALVRPPLLSVPASRPACFTHSRTTVPVGLESTP
jgi:FAD binding domain